MKDLTLRAKGAGLTNVWIDPDGKRRRIRLFENVGGKWYAQLGFAAALELLGRPPVEVSDEAVTLKDIKVADGSTRPLRIPLDDQGMMLIHWQKTAFKDSFTHVSFYYVIDLAAREGRVVETLEDLARRDSWKVWNGDNAAQGLVDSYDSWKVLRDKALDAGTENQYRRRFKPKRNGSRTWRRLWQVGSGESAEGRRWPTPLAER